jgi:hypothetical protein
LAAGLVEGVCPVDLWFDFGFLVFEFEGWEDESVDEVSRRAWRALREEACGPFPDQASFFVDGRPVTSDETIFEVAKDFSVFSVTQDSGLAAGRGSSRVPVVDLGAAEASAAPSAASARRACSAPPSGGRPCAKRPRACVVHGVTEADVNAALRIEAEIELERGADAQVQAAEDAGTEFHYTPTPSSPPD